MTEIDASTGRRATTNRALHVRDAAVSPFTLWSLSLIAVIVGASCATRARHVRGDALRLPAAHLLVGPAVAGGRTTVFVLSIVGIFLLWALWGILTIWYLYRVIRGWLLPERPPARAGREARLRARAAVALAACSRSEPPARSSAAPAGTHRRPRRRRPAHRRHRAPGQGRRERCRPQALAQANSKGW
jgi:hypothetical protein